MWPEHIQCMTTHRLPHSIRHRGGDLQLLVSGLHPRSSDPSHGADNGVHTDADAARGGRRCEKIDHCVGGVRGYYVLKQSWHVLQLRVAMRVPFSVQAPAHRTTAICPRRRKILTSRSHGSLTHISDSITFLFLKPKGRCIDAWM
jgi:hypothetical protein